MRSSFQYKNEFSWSLARHNLFNYCKRAYFFHYYASWNGWLDDSPHSQKLIYRLKQIKTQKEWVDELILEAITKALRREIELNIQPIKSYCFRKAYAELISLQNNEFLKDPKKLSLFSRYYDGETISMIKERVSDSIKGIFEKLDCENISLLLKRNYMDFISSNELVKFQLGQIPVWCKSGFIYHNKEEIVINNFRFNDFRYDNNWAFSGAISFIYALKNLLRYNKKLQSVTTFVYEKGVLPVYSMLTPQEAVETILSSAKDMLSFLPADSDASADNFSKCSEKEKCRKCNFKEACAASN